jgi:hypothetical protein
MSDHAPESQTASPEATRDDAIDQSRRKLTGAALGVSAVFTLASRPVLAGQCTTASNAASGNLSQHGSVTPCTGKTVATWAATPNANRNYPGGNPQFTAFFTNGNKATWGDQKLKAVMNLSVNGNNGNTGNKPNPISAEFAAALLNIRGGLVPATVLTEMQLIGMWNEWVADGIFEPKAGARWDANHIVTYLQTLQA